MAVVSREEEYDSLAPPKFGGLDINLGGWSVAPLERFYGLQEI